MGSVLSLFSEVEPVPPQYQVFINFRGDEVREGFIGFLEEALRREQVNVFIDHNELRGTPLDHLFATIQESRIALTIFSRRYTESNWCLDELVTIKECMDQGNLRVIPIFFNVEPRDVRLLSGPFGENFRNPAFRFHRTPETERWNQALLSVSQVLGLCYTNYRRQSLLVTSTVREVKRVLEDIARIEAMEAERQRTYLTAIREEVAKSVARYLSLLVMVALFLGPYLIGILWLFVFFIGQFKIIRVVERDW